MIRQWARVGVACVLSLGLAGCGGGDKAGAGTGSDCSVTSCTVTFQRSASASPDPVSILGVKAQLISVQGGLVNLQIGGQVIALPSDGTQDTADGLRLSVTSVTKDHVVVKISRD